MKDYLKEISAKIKLRNRVVIYLPNKLAKTRQLAQDLLKMPEHKQAKCLDIFIDKPTQQVKHKPELRRAIGLCNERNADLIIPNLGVQAQSIHFLAEVTGLAKKKFYSVTRPNGDILIIPMDIQTMAQIAQNVRKDIQAKTKAKLKELKEQGVKLGAPDPIANFKEAWVANRKIADNHALEVLPHIKEIQALGFKTLTEIAKMLNQRNVKTAKGGKFYPTTVKNILDRSKYL